MKEFIGETIERRVPPNRYEAVQDYLRSVSADERDRTMAEVIRPQIALPARPLARHVVCIPVAAHQESQWIAPALEQYAQQQDSEPFSVVLGLNSPTYQQGNVAIGETLRQVAMAKQRYPHLDVRSAMTYYDEPKIGMVRRDIWNAVLLQSAREGAYSGPGADEVIGINHDIDTVALTPRYMARVQRHYRRKQVRYAASGLSDVILPVATSVTRHAFDAQYPQSSLGAKWVDYATGQTNNWYEAGLIVPMSKYADAGGFRSVATTYETAPFVHDIQYDHRVPGALYATSPRRYVDRLRYGFDTIWTPDSFGAEDECRDMSDRGDLSLERLQFLMTASESLHASIRYSAQLAMINRLDSLGILTSESNIDDYVREVISSAVGKIATMAEVALRGFGLYDWGHHIYNLSTDTDFMRSVTDIALGVKDSDE